MQKRILYGAIASPVDPSDVSIKVKGAVVMASGLIIFGAAAIFHVSLTATDVTSLAVQLSGVAGALAVVYDFILDVVRWAGTKGWVKA